MSAVDDRLALAELRAKRLEAITDGYDVYDAPDSTVTGAAGIEYVTSSGVRRPLSHPRCVLLTQYGDKGNYRVHLAENRAGVERLAAYLATDTDGSEAPICYFDLDQLAGEAPHPCEGDVVRVTAEGLERAGLKDDGGNEYHVVGTETDTFDGQAFERLYLSRNHDADWLSGDYDAKLDEQYVEVVEPAWPDERMPVRYGLAKVVVSVVFNTVPSP